LGEVVVVKKIDFHIHTVSDLTKDSDFTYNPEWMKQYIAETQLDAISTTNHNLFDIGNFNQVREDIKDLGVKVFPGMELNLLSGHVNIVGDDTKEFIEAFESLSEVTKKLGSNGNITVKQLTDNFSLWKDLIYIFECGKANEMKVPDGLKDCICVGGVANVNKFNKLKIDGTGLVPVYFSDAHADPNDSNPVRCEIARLANKTTYIQTDDVDFNSIKNAIKVMDKVALNKNFLNDIFEIDSKKFSTGLNLIVGERGSGKSHLFDKTLVKQLPMNPFYIKQFETSNVDEFVKSETQKYRQTSFNRWIDRYSKQISSILTYSQDDYAENALEEYILNLRKYATEVTNSAAVKSIRVLRESKFELSDLSIYEESLKSVQELIDNTSLWSIVDIKYKNSLIEMYTELRSKYITEHKHRTFKEAINGYIKKIQNSTKSFTGVTGDVPNPNFASYVNEQKSSEKVNKISSQIIKSIEIDRHSYADNYDIIISVKPFDRAAALTGNAGIERSSDFFKFYKTEDYCTFFKKLTRAKGFNANRFKECFVEVINGILFDGKTASGGQVTAFSLLMKLDEAKNYDYILIDEPESSLDNPFIKNALIKKIKDLSKNSTVFVITHNSTLGTLLEPDYLVVTKYDKTTKEYQILSGEFSSHKLNGSERSFEEFLNAMEAGIDTYKEKGRIYEDLKK
jgi:ABC-type lipoprotein export system ATPase subunit